MEMQTAPSFGRTDSIVIPFPGQATEAPATSPQDITPDTLSMTTGRTYTFKQAAELLKCGDESTLRNRYWKEKIEPAFRHCPTPLQSIAKYDRNGNPVYRLNDAAIEVFQAFLAAKAEGKEDAFLLTARQQYPAPAAPTAVTEVPATEPETPTQTEAELQTSAIVVPQSKIQLLGVDQQTELALIHSLYVKPEPVKTFQSIELNGDQETILEGLKLLHSTVSQMKSENNRIKSDTTKRKSDIELANEAIVAIAQEGKKAVEENFELVAEAQSVQAEESEAKKRLAQLLKALGDV